MWYNLSMSRHTITSILATFILFPVFLLGCGSSAKHLSEARDLADRAATAQAASLKATQQNQPQAAQEQYAESRELYGQAIVAYQQARADVSSNAERVLEFAEVAEAAGERDLAALAYHHLTELEPDEWKWKLNAGRSYRLAGDAFQDNALRFLQACTTGEGAPDDIRADAYVELGKIYWGLGLFENAGGFFSSAQALNPDHTPARIGTAAVAIRDGDMAAGSTILDGLVQVSQEDTALMNFLLADALRRFDDSRGIFPDTAEQHYAYARLLVRVGKYYETMLALERSVALNGDNYPAYNLLGGVLSQIGEQDRARKAYETSLEMNPDQPRTREILGQLQ
ncbi:MAG: hypothetical protein COA73_07870 [Candidatus Hydrogenedentota bacterium]|nr:MAG: hypothetical protein COA73_07870 [Candidatus Hydrogenedentota bacterium]